MDKYEIIVICNKNRQDIKDLVNEIKQSSEILAFTGDNCLPENDRLSRDAWFNRCIFKKYKRKYDRVLLLSPLYNRDDYPVEAYGIILS